MVVAGEGYVWGLVKCLSRCVFPAGRKPCIDNDMHGLCSRHDSLRHRACSVVPLPEVPVGNWLPDM